MPVLKCLRQSDGWYWTCECGKASGTWPTESQAQFDFNCHGDVCSLNADRDD